MATTAKQRWYCTPDSYFIWCRRDPEDSWAYYDDPDKPCLGHTTCEFGDCSEPATENVYGVEVCERHGN